MKWLLVAGLCLVSVLPQRVGAQVMGSFPSAQSLLDRWCERNVDAISVRVAFQRFEYDDAFRTVKTADGELVCDPNGESAFRSAPPKVSFPSVGRYASTKEWPLHWRWTRSEFLMIDDDRKDFQRIAVRDYETAERGWFTNMFDFARITQTRFVPGIDPRRSLDGFRFEVSKVRSQQAYLRGVPEPGTREAELIGEVRLLLSLEPVELRAVQYQDLTGKHRVVLKYDAPEVNPPPQRFDLSSYKKLVW